MQEYLSEAVVLNAYPNGDMDLRVSLFTRKFGKLVAKVKSAKKITSKLAGHLQPGDLSRVRLVEKGGLQAVDALKSSRLGTAPLNLYFLDRVLHEAEPDPELWQVVAGSPDAGVGAGLDWRRILKILGWDPAEAFCRACRGQANYFYPRDQEFFCAACLPAGRHGASKMSPDEIIFVE